MPTLDSVIKSLNARVEKTVDGYLKNAELANARPVPSFPKDFVEFNKMIGLPPSIRPGKPAKILPYQSMISKAIDRHHKVIINKSRKIGATETVLRHIAKGCFELYAGFNVMIIAGNRQTQAEELLLRFDKLFEKGLTDLNGTRFSYHDIVKKKTKTGLEFFNGTRVHTYPAIAEALRGPDRVACVFLDEAAHFKQIDDSQVYDALKPNLANTNGDFIIVSTPNGRRGIFYDLWTEERYHKLELPYTVALGELLSEKFIAEERADTRIDFEQEYECKFTSSLSAAFDKELLMKIYKPGKVTDYSDILDS